MFLNFKLYLCFPTFSTDKDLATDPHTTPKHLNNRQKPVTVIFTPTTSLESPVNSRCCVPVKFDRFKSFISEKCSLI